MKVGDILFKTVEQIHAEFDGHWVFLINCKEGEHNSVSGRVVAIASKQRDRVLREMEAYRGEKSDTYIFYAGRIPKGVSVLLWLKQRLKWIGLVGA